MFHPALFSGMNVVVTGGGRGIGLEVARQFLDCGARVVVHTGRTIPRDRPVFLDLAAGEGRAFLCGADFVESGGVQALADEVGSRFDSLDVLVNNAGTMVGRFPAAELTDEEYRAILRLNQTSVVEMTRAMLPLLRKGAHAAIVNTVSISARTGGSAGSSIYSATKAFVATYSKALARELAPEGIRVNCVSPGTIATDFHQRYSTPEKLEATRKSIPLGRLGTADDCAPAYLFLASHALSGYITGQILEVNGGQLIC
ncbi:SDR family NAD(P)-dependent oxidoreductase [Sinorhizobium alkalisoli]|uniref:Oxidoreductase n=1 Tax=Sinorhizobium alkalisoli TaxID=1752398 RepID=A0A1E3VCA4_9HYPH|nr:SDR family oxidoreductase [Sinorhizobium alkalisoli]MCA1492660.1 SDR family oxidoreductase [Ensifer sp. NBAIM29]MCG5480197.1 SDR family oxidoreductase [Sinorhizobium alkalisoli]ODR91077.1 oxidoreductase [Sinorhizobium alkalisoli]QFI67846.1 3-oxoacyl-[acyl-carrier protein] reductase [Sinorhizobium alkalisoli]